MNISLIFTILLALPVAYAQGPFQWCDIICNVIKRCTPTKTFCNKDNIVRFGELCNCPVPAFTSRPPITTRRPTTRRPTTRRPTTRAPTTTRRPTFQNECGSGSMGRARTWLNSQPKIVGGYNSEPGYFPWQVKVRPGGAHCGGTIISRDTVLTAAHCMVGYENNPSATTVYYGSNDIRSSNIREVKPISVTVHPNYGRNGHPDIAILKLGESFKFSQNFQPACLPPRDKQFFAGDLAVVSGWGLLSEGSGRIPNRMRYVPVPIVDTNVCNRNYNNGIRTSEVCAGYTQGGKDACQGDSGGSLIMPSRAGNRWEVVGVVSRGSGCARPGLPGIYAKVPDYIGWIENLL